MSWAGRAGQGNSKKDQAQAKNTRGRQGVHQQEEQQGGAAKRAAKEQQEEEQQEEQQEEEQQEEEQQEGLYSSILHGLLPFSDPVRV